ncbi:MAG: NFACT family protein [Oscillospiraceae bacterium]|nr:NFACT family protein [Oscillospiraceae bacterium]
MPLDAICLSALTGELSEKLAGAKIDKIQQPERDMILLSMRGRGENLRLLIAAGTGNARVHLSKSAFENPAEPPMFCMFLRKHLTGARILSVTQPKYERVLKLELETRDELGVEGQKTLIAELIGRSANIILVDAEGRILDCLRRMDYGGDLERRMLPGMFYRDVPPQTKPALLETEPETIRAMIENADRTRPIDKWLLDSFAGLSPLVCRELSFRCGGEWTLLAPMLDAFTESVKAGELRPYLFFDGKKPVDFCFMRLKQYGDALRCEEADSFSDMLDRFYTGRDKIEQQRRRGHELLKTVRTVRDRQQRKLNARYEELKKSEDRESVRRTAEFITANLYRLKKGDSVLHCQDYYEPDCPEIEIALDPLKTPQQNAAVMFKDYNKRKAASEHLTTLIAEGEAQLDYLNSVLELIGAAESEKDLTDLRHELVDTGYIKASAAKKREKVKAQAPLRFVSSDGREILVGRSNLQNDELTTKLGRRTDYWLHTQKIHGSHVLIRCEGEPPSDRCIEEAAVIAAYYSQGRGGGKIPVDYTMLRFVRKPSGALPGKVIYTDYKTITVESDEELVNKLRVK